MSSDALRDHLIDKICIVEGGYVNDPSDLGGETCWGITKDTALAYKHLWSLFNFNGDMQTLPRALAKAIYHEGWWKSLKCDEIMSYSPNLAERILDFSVNAGRTNAIRSLQRILNVMNQMGRLYPNLVADGYIGPVTLRRLQQYFGSGYQHADEKIVMLMYSMQNYHYIDISEKRAGETNERFTRGWINRVYGQWVEYLLRLSTFKER